MNTFDIALVTSALVAGSGAVRFTGPLILGFEITNLIAAISSRIEMKDQYCLPDPSLPPAPSLKIGSSRLHAPPFLAATNPVLMFTTRTPAAFAGSAAFSQATTTSAKNPEPAGVVSSTCRSAVSPYQPMALPATKTSGLSSAAAFASREVESTRDDRIKALYLSVQRPSPTPAPARLMITLTPASCEKSNSPADGFQ